MSGELPKIIGVAIAEDHSFPVYLAKNGKVGNWDIEAARVRLCNELARLEERDRLERLAFLEDENPELQVRVEELKADGKYADRLLEAVKEAEQILQNAQWRHPGA